MAKVTRKEVFDETVKANLARSKMLAETVLPPEGYTLIREGVTLTGDKIYSDQKPGAWNDVPDWEVGKPVFHFWLIARKLLVQGAAT